MLLEPAPTQYDLHFRLAGFPVRVHPAFFLITFLLGLDFNNPDPIPALLWIVAAFVSILIHELGHALAYRRYGIDSGIVLYSFGGLAIPRSYGARALSTGQRVFVSFAGPGAGFLFAGLIFGGLWAAGYGWPRLRMGGFLPQLVPSGPGGRLGELISYLAFVNVWWGLMNLLPVFPLDGGQISRALFTHRNPYDGLRQSLTLSIVVGALVAVYGVLSRQLFLALLFGSLAFQSYLLLQSSRFDSYDRY